MGLYARLIPGITVSQAAADARAALDGSAACCDACTRPLLQLLPAGCRVTGYSCDCGRGYQREGKPLPKLASTLQPTSAPPEP